MFYVIGSGPSGVAAARALLRKGVKVTMLDAGVELETDKKAALEKLARSREWDDGLLNKLKADLDPGAMDQFLKLSYGSDYTYKDVQNHMPVVLNGALCRPSFAKGGLSTVWGAHVMPYSDEDMKEWPLSVNDLAPYYEEVLKFMKIACASDNIIAPGFPLYTDKPGSFELSKQAAALLKGFQKNSEKLQAKGMTFGSSRLAVQFQGSAEKLACNYNGRCLYGCPYKLIYSSEFTLEELKKDRNFTYIPNIVLDMVEERENGIVLFTHDRVTGKSRNFLASRAFLACGAIPTTKIMLASTNSYDKETIIKDSQRFDLPCLMHKSTGDVTKQNLHALCQLTLEVFDKKISPHSVHLQIYTYNDLYEKLLRKKFGVLYKILKKPLKAILNRIILIRGYIHSDSSSTISMKLLKGSPDGVVLKGIENPATKKAIRKLASKLFSNQGITGIMPIIPMLKIGEPGASNHYGGSFPMRKNPQKFESDTFGRPFGFKRLHILDASVFPSIASQSITLTVMANACRIADNYDKAD